MLAEFIKQFKGVWVLALGLLIGHFVSYNIAFSEFLSRLLNVPHNASPQDNPPLYFLRQDVVAGLCFGAGMLLTVLLVAITWRRFQPYSFVTLWLAWLFCMPGIVKAASVYVRCPNLLDPRGAKSAWLTFEDYIHDPYLKGAMYGTMAVGVVLAYVTRHSRWRFDDRHGAA